MTVSEFIKDIQEQYRDIELDHTEILFMTPEEKLEWGYEGYYNGILGNDEYSTYWMPGELVIVKN